METRDLLQYETLEQCISTASLWNGFEKLFSLYSSEKPFFVMIYIQSISKALKNTQITFEKACC